MLEVAVQAFAEVVSGKKNFETAAKNVGRQTLRKQLASGSRKKTNSRIIPTKSADQTGRLRRDTIANKS